MEPVIFARLPTYSGPSFFGLDEMHLLGQGMGRLIHNLIITTCMTTGHTKYMHKKDDDTFNMSGYSFAVVKKDLLEVGKCIEASRSKIPVSFQGSWDNLIVKTDGARAVDFLDFLLFVIPTLIVPLFRNTSARRALLSLVKGCAIALQWELDESMIKEMEK